MDWWGSKLGKKVKTGNGAMTRASKMFGSRKKKRRRKKKGRKSGTWKIG